MRHPPNHDTGAEPAKRPRLDRRDAPRGASRAGYIVVVVWPLACLAVYAWQVIGIAGG